MSGTTALKVMVDLQVLALAPLFFPEEAEKPLKATVLIIEDDKAIADLITLYLGRDGIETVHAMSGESGLEAFERDEPDLVVLDINLPGMDGYEVLQNLKRRGDVPVVMVTARQEDEDAILGFGMGADDYVSKPFSPKVLAARIRTHLTRVRKADAAVKAAATGSSDPDGDVVMEFGPYRLDARTFTLLKDGEKISLSPREIDLLIHLVRNPGRPLGQNDLYKEVWGREYGDLSTVAVHIQRLRKKIEEDPANPRWLKTSHGRGYFFDIDGISGEGS